MAAVGGKTPVPGEDLFGSSWLDPAVLDIADCVRYVVRNERFVREGEGPETCSKFSPDES